MFKAACSDCGNECEVSFQPMLDSLFKAILEKIEVSKGRVISL